MSSLESKITAVKNYLASHYMKVDDEWIAGCVEYLSEDSSNNYSLSDIQNLAKEQWLLNDLKEICPGSLPPNLKNTPKTVLNGHYVLQINAAIDIGTPSYQQYLKLQKTNMENIEATTKFEDKIPNHRMIKLYMTDGVQDVTAIEYKPMRNLTCDITPGCKICLKGPIESRRGVLLLTESCIELLGGEVSEITVSNSLAGLLASKLELPMPQESTLNTTISIPRNLNTPTPHTQMPPRMNPPINEPTDQISRPVARVTSLQVSTINDDEIDIDQIAAIEAEYSSNKRSSDSTLDKPNPEKKAKIVTQNNPEDYPDDNDIFCAEDEDYLRELEEKFESDTVISPVIGPVQVSSEPFVYIKQIKDMSEAARCGKVFRVKGQIMKLLSKLSVSKEGWSLKCTIIDGTDNLDVDFTSEVLTKLVGFTPNEMNRIKKQMATKPELKERAVAALQKAKETLQELYCIIEITISDVPKITRLITFEDTHLSMLRKRIDGSVL